MAEFHFGIKLVTPDDDQTDRSVWKDQIDNWITQAIDQSDMVPGAISVDIIDSEYRPGRPADFPKLKWVNAYEVRRQYGGPEEGGWWYDVGEPLAAMPLREPRSIGLVVKTLWLTLGPDYNYEIDEELGVPTGRAANEDKKRIDRYSVIGDRDLDIVVEDAPPKPYPERTPHYE